MFFLIYLGQYRQNGWSLRNRTNCQGKNGKKLKLKFIFAQIDPNILIFFRRNMKKNPKFSVKAMLAVIPVVWVVVGPGLVAIAVVVAAVQELVALLVA